MLEAKSSAAAQKRRFEDPLEEDVSARGAEQPPGRHLAGPESGLRHREVDVVHHGEDEHHEPHAQQDEEERPAAVGQFEGVVDRFEIEFAQRDEPHLLDDIAYIGPINLLEEGEHVGDLGLQVGPLAGEQERNAGAAVGHAFVVGRVGLGDALGPHDDVGRRNRRAFDVAHDAADDIDALVVVHAERLTQRVKGPEDLAGERLREDDILAGGQRLFARTFEQREVEHPEEGRVGVEHRGEELLPADLHGGRTRIRILEDGHGTGRFDLGIAVAQILLKIVAAGHRLFGADGIDTVGLGLIVVDRELADRVVGHE